MRTKGYNDYELIDGERVFNRYITAKEADYLGCLWDEKREYEKNLRDAKKIGCKDIKHYEEYINELVKKLEIEIQHVRWEGLTNTY